MPLSMIYFLSSYAESPCLHTLMLYSSCCRDRIALAVTIVVLRVCSTFIYCLSFDISIIQNKSIKRKCFFLLIKLYNCITGSSSSTSGSSTSKCQHHQLHPHQSHQHLRSHQHHYHHQYQNSIIIINIVNIILIKIINIFDTIHLLNLTSS